MMETWFSPYSHPMSTKLLASFTFPLFFLVNLVVSLAETSSLNGLLALCRFEYFSASSKSSQKLVALKDGFADFFWSEYSENGEDIQVLKYEHGQKYDVHYDFFSDQVNIARCGHRIATVLMYLSDVGKGGETVFPSAEESLRHSNAEEFSECARHGIAVKPKKGDALLFFSLYPNATPDRSSLHGGCPVVEGEKWSATKWIHVSSFDKIVTSHGNCTDNNPSCDRWAALGECTKNPEYMVGTSELPGYCRRSCNVC